MWIPMEARLLEQRSRSDAILRGKVHRMRGMFQYFSVEPKEPKQRRARQVMTAARSRDAKALEKLVAEDNSSIESTDWLGRTPLHWAVMFADQRLVQWVLGLPGGRDLVNVADDDGWTPLHVAGFVGNTDVVEALLAAGADPAARDKRKLTPHEWAIAKKNVTAARLLKSPAKR